MPNKRTLAWLGQKHNLYSMTGCQPFWGCFYLLRIFYWSGWLSEYLKSVRDPKNNISYICPILYYAQMEVFSIYHKREIHYEVFLTHNLSSRKSEINAGCIMERKSTFHRSYFDIFRNSRISGVGKLNFIIWFGGNDLLASRVKLKHAIILNCLMDGKPSFELLFSIMKAGLLSYL